MLTIEVLHNHFFKDVTLCAWHNDNKCWRIQNVIKVITVEGEFIWNIKSTTIVQQLFFLNIYV